MDSFIVELHRRLRGIQQGEIAHSELYSMIHQLGEAGLTDARSTIEQFLGHEDPQLRYIALEVLTRHFRCDEHWHTAKGFLLKDSDPDCRRMGASALNILKRNTQDWETLHILAQVVCNEEELTTAREAAYIAMLGIIQFNPQQQFELSLRGLHLERDVDWTMVKSYLNKK